VAAGADGAVAGAGHERGADRRAGFYQRGPGPRRAAQLQRRRDRVAVPRYAGGRPPTFTLARRREIKKIAKSRPAEHGLPFSRWSLANLADFLVAEGVVEDISHEGLRELLRAENVSFQAVKTWKASADPHYAAKKARGGPPVPSLSPIVAVRRASALVAAATVEAKARRPASARPAAAARRSRSPATDRPSIRSSRPGRPLRWRHPRLPGLDLPGIDAVSWQRATVAQADQTRTAGGIGAARAVVLLSVQRRAGRRDRSVVSSQCARLVL
jgi:hypothetical protein